MKKLKIFLIIVGLILIIGIGFFWYKDYKEKERIRNAIIKVELIDDLNVKYKEELYLSNLIKSINGTLCDDYLIKTDKLGEQKIKFYFVNEEEIKVSYEFTINVADKTPPVVWLNSSYSVNVGYKGSLVDDIMCGDDLDDNPHKEIVGDYDLNKVGTYPLIYKAVDNKGNATMKSFSLVVKKKTSGSSSSKKPFPFKDIYKEHKNTNTKIGLDVSRWQGNIDFSKVKEAGVEFVFIKVGGTNGLGGDYYVDPQFKRNIEGFLEVGIPVGIYFYTYANSPEKAKEDALWVMEQIKDYEITLPIAYDWENWSSFNKFKMSFEKLTNSALAFIETVNKKGYEGILYSSKNYLEKIWLPGDYPVWLAHYTDKTNYQGDYDYWQMTSSCKISGITANTVDVNIMYLD